MIRETDYSLNSQIQLVETLKEKLTREEFIDLSNMLSDINNELFILVSSIHEEMEPEAFDFDWKKQNV